MKVGILGGTFNPIHIGHLVLAEEARQKLKLDRVIFVPAYLPPHKASRGLAKAAQRYMMVKLAIKGNKYFRLSDIEIKRNGYSYTIDTLRELKKTLVKDKLYFITGSDLLDYLDDWKGLREVVKIARFVVATRPGYPLKKLPAYISTLAIRAIDISAFRIRQAIKKNRSIRYLVPREVYRYIERNKLYR